MDAKTFLQGYVPLFSELSEEHLVEVASRSTLKAYKPGQTVLFQGVTVEELHVVAVGKVAVFAKVPGQGVVQVAELGQGEVFGEASIFESGTASAAVKAAADSQILVIPQDAFRKVLGENPAFGEKVKALIAARRAPRA